MSGRPIDDLTSPGDAPWYAGITRYQWMVLVIASLGWIFDVFEGQIFVASMNEAMRALVPGGTSPGTIEYYKQITLAAFLLGGAIGGVVFGMLSDRIGRKKTMSLTIIMYSLFTCVSAFSTEWWHMAVFRFLVAMGVGGEWAVASTLVAEEFPQKARARVSGIFHASSVLGTYLAIATAAIFIGNEQIHDWAERIGYPSAPWRIGFGVGMFPALLIIWIRRSLKEPQSWVKAKSIAQDTPREEMGRMADLFRGELFRSTIVGVSLAAVGLVTFWGVHIVGRNLLRRDIEQKLLRESSEDVLSLSPERKAEILKAQLPVIKRWELLGMFLVTTGGGLGLLSFGPLCERIGRRPAFLIFHLGGLAVSLVCFQWLSGVGVWMVALVAFGFLTLGMHAGYAIYLPELYPTRLRGTGAGFCFNFGRILVVPLLVISGKMQTEPKLNPNAWEKLTNLIAFDLSFEETCSILSWLFLLGVVVLIFAPETKGKELPE